MHSRNKLRGKEKQTPETDIYVINLGFVTDCSSAILGNITCTYPNSNISESQIRKIYLSNETITGRKRMTAIKVLYTEEDKTKGSSVLHRLRSKTFVNILLG